MKRLIIFFSSMVILYSCASNEAQVTDQIYKELKPKEAHVTIKIKDELFYSHESKFQGNINLGTGFSDINIIDQFGGNIQLQMAKNNWLKSEKKTFNVSPNNGEEYPNYGNMLIGKRDSSSFKGYILSRGNFEWLLLNTERAILKLDGYFVRPQDARIPQNEIPFEGKIYFNQPRIDLNDLDISDL